MICAAIDYSENILENFTKIDAFSFCDFCPKAAEYREIFNAQPAPSVTFQTTDRDAPVIKGREARETHHTAEHRGDGML